MERESLECCDVLLEACKEAYRWIGEAMIDFNLESDGTHEKLKEAIDAAGKEPPQIMDSDQYRETGGGKCPVCFRDDIEGGFIEVDSNIAWQPILCNLCGSGWNDIYELKGYEDLTKCPIE